jgi:hypothetical protein
VCLHLLHFIRFNPVMLSCAQSMPSKGSLLELGAPWVGADNFFHVVVCVLEDLLKGTVFPAQLWLVRDRGWRGPLERCTTDRHHIGAAHDFFWVARTLAVLQIRALQVLSELFLPV